MTTLPPSVYISRLRRAFFLRVHPDRFRSSDVSVRRQQAKLVQALNDRMSWPDFISYNYGSSATATATRPSQQQTKKEEDLLHYVLEHRDGSILRQSILLNDSVENILFAMSQALEDSGAASLPPPPKVQYKPSPNRAEEEDNNKIHWHDDNDTNNGHTNHNNNGGSNIDHRFDINTTKGRDLLSFCQTLDRQQVEERRQYRMDASAAALMSRQLYQFQSIDGISLHWSSRSFAILLQSLNALWEEHNTKFHVQSFYPLRVVFSYNDYQLEEALDLFGGVLHLHPGYTPIQWLEILRQVTPQRLAKLQQHRQALEVAQKRIQSALGVRLKKGFTCASENYYDFVLQLAHHLRLPPEDHNNNKDDNLLPMESTTAVALESIQVTVEAADACRFRSVITPEGHIRVGCGMSVDKVISSIHQDSNTARERRDQERILRKISNQHAKQVQYELGLTRQVYKAGTFRIGHEEFQNCLQRILDLEPDQKSHLRLSLGGNALGVAGSGQFCQLGDDGSILIPHDWSIAKSSSSSSSNDHQQGSKKTAFSW